ncbi:hypothetical protein LGM90_14635 [Burkholderia sp. AU28942]|uniref:hypothetical protein n=1 Tax=Burkholderia TaxID=32008 RepID=UPI0008418CB6|nr:MULTISPECIES: hypothetical protein [Burkholderia]AOK07390.1 hypothetical protein WK25_23075 [Burkholderia latens]MCA8309747.1 hypothetical protein [Burkholderia sp. AU28942]QTO51105.1 hypothetical protein J8I86_16800 [Burkholderia latens]
MTRAERPDGLPVGEPKPSWGPGKNAALSIVAFAAIFGAFAYVERDTRVDHASVTHDIAGVIGSAVGKYRSFVVAATAGPASASGESGASGVAAAGGPTSPVAQAATPAALASGTPSVSAAAEPPVPPLQSGARSTGQHARPAHAPPARLAAGAYAASASARTGRPADAHRTSRTQALARARKHADPVPGLQPQSYIADTTHMETASVTRDELEGARALARARSCAQIDAWNCVEQNASRALAIDPRNSESRALLGQAIRNRL